jgi:hypothetical protein
MVIRYYEELEVPKYTKQWRYCPVCGVEWEGPIRCDVDNEYMYGPKRLSVWNKVQARRQADGWKQPEYTGLWWVIVERSVWRGDTAQAGNVGDWTPKNYSKVSHMPAAKMLYLLRDHQARLDADHNNDPHSFCDYEAKIVETYVEPTGGYEICNYDWERNEPDYRKPKADRAAGTDALRA